MKTNISLRDVVEIIGVISIVISLFFVGLQMRQEQNLFQSGNAISVLETLIERNNSVIANSELWVAGNRGDDLSVADFVSYERMINSYNEVTFQTFLSAQVSGASPGGGLPAIAEFADFLATNPGAFKVWNDRENRISENFARILPSEVRSEGNVGRRYRSMVLQAVETLSMQD